MLVHSVYFWLKSDLTDAERAQFKEGVESLKAIESSVATYVGTVADTDRPVIDRTYDFALTVVFESMADHDKYQVDPIHLKFVETFKPMFEKLVIYDAD